MYMVSVKCSCGCSAFLIDYSQKKKECACPECGRVLSLPHAITLPDSWYYTQNGKRQGPVTTTQLCQMAMVGHLLASDMVIQAGAQQWVNASAIPGLIPAKVSARQATPNPTLGVSAEPVFPVQNRNPVSANERPIGRVYPSPTQPVRRTDPPSRGFGMRIILEVCKICTATFGLVSRFVGYCGALWQRRTLRRQAIAARRELGHRMYHVGQGEPQVRDRIASVGNQILSAEAAKLSSGSLKAEHSRMIEKLAEVALQQPIPPRSAEAEYNKAQTTRTAFREQNEKISKARKALLPMNCNDWARVITGLGTVCLLVVFMGYWLLSSKAVITGIDEKDLRQAVGWVICGRKYKLPDSAEVEEPIFSGSCFAVSSEGHLLTNRHVIKETWEDLQIPAKKQAIEARGRQIGVTIEPKVWVFFGQEKFVANILYLSSDYDLAILKIERRHVPFFRISTVDSPSRGAEVVACGFPTATRGPISEEERIEEVLRQNRIGLGIQAGKTIRVESFINKNNYEFDQTFGTVNRNISEESGCKWILHLATIHQGNSGGPLIGRDGTVIGINTRVNLQTSGVNYALSMPQLREVIDKHVAGAVWK